MTDCDDRYSDFFMLRNFFFVSVIDYASGIEIDETNSSLTLVE